MQKDVNTAVFTCMDRNFENNLISDFLKTLRSIACYQGRIVILDYGMSSEAVEKVKGEFGAEVIKCSRDRHIFSVRFRDIVSAIDSLPPEITHIMTIDGGDVWFQGPIDEIFRLCDTKIGYVEDYFLDNSLWNNQLLHMLRPDEMNKLRKNLLGTRQKNAGMICGPRNIVSSVCDTIAKYVLNYGLDFFGLDQLYFNYIINTMDDSQKIALPKKYNYVLIDTRCRHIIEDGLVYDANHEPVTVVHNAGGGDRRVIAKETPEDFDNNQYKRVIQIYK